MGTSLHMEARGNRNTATLNMLSEAQAGAKRSWFTYDLDYKGAPAALPASSKMEELWEVRREGRSHPVLERIWSGRIHPWLSCLPGNGNG